MCQRMRMQAFQIKHTWLATYMYILKTDQKQSELAKIGHQRRPMLNNVTSSGSDNVSDLSKQLLTSDLQLPKL